MDRSAQAAPGEPGEPGEREAAASAPALALLAAAAGALDAGSYLGLGEVFTANMTGNTVKLGVFLAQSNGGGVLRSGVALAGFCGGVALGAAFGEAAAQPPRRAARRGLALELAALVALAAVWLAAGVGEPGVRFGLIALSALAMGLQSAAARSIGPRGVATTYMTGTLTRAVVRATRALRGGGDSSEPAGAPLPAGVWLLYGAAALGGAFAEQAWHGSVVVVAVILVTLATWSAVRRLTA